MRDFPLLHALLHARRLPAVLYAAALAAALLCPVPSRADERILNFASDITIHPDSSMTVTETITVRSEGVQIKRGIYRDFPTIYKTPDSGTMRVGFEVLRVLKDGEPEPWFVKSISNGKRVYIGREDVFIPSGVHTYEITYSTDRQLGYFDDYDELYWNVTGNGWSFSIDAVEAVVHLPPGATVLNMAGYTGRYGQSGKDFEGFVRPDGSAYFRTTRMLYGGEGLTIAVSWPRGLVEPPPVDLFTPPMMALLGTLLILAYYILAWVMVGKDPAKGTIIPLFEPPLNFSPAALRFVNRMGFDNRCVACAVIDMAVKGYLSVSKGTTYYKLSLNEQADSRRHLLSLGEKKLATGFFNGGLTDELVLKQKNHARVRKGIDGLKTFLKLEFEATHFRTNRLWFIPGALLTLVTMFAMGAAAHDSGDALGAVFMFSFWTIPVAILGWTAIKAWLTPGSSKGGALFLTLFLLPFVAADVFFLFLLMGAVSPHGVAMLILLIGVNFAFYHWLKAPTFSGRRLMDQIEGFKMYLETAEQERFKELQPPDRTLELFERYLPYALALDVEHAWSEQFADVLAAASQSGDGHYHPAWYRSSNYAGLSTAAFTTALAGAVTSAVASSSTAPGSSSGSGGGGFSGGGGGGGGGGGW